MHVFLSWSGQVSRAVAEALSPWLEHVLPNVETFVSSNDIDAGERWEARLTDELEAAHHAVLCVTRENQTAPWLLYEAGALGKLVSRARVIPYTIGFPPGELKVGPIGRLQGVQSDRAGTWDLVRSLNRALPTSKNEEFVREAFETWWPQLEAQITKVMNQSPQMDNSPSTHEMLIEMRADMKRLVEHVRRTELEKARERAGRSQIFARSLRIPAIHDRFVQRTRELEEANAPIAIACIDLDRFGQVNKEFGHDVGDQLLAVIATLLVESLPESYEVFGRGGDEFLILCADTSHVDVERHLQTFLGTLPKTLVRLGLPPVTASIGLSAMGRGSSSVHEEQAERARLEAKARGGNCMVAKSSEA